MSDSSPLFTGIYSKFPNILKLIIEDLVVLFCFYMILTSFNIFFITAVGISVSVLLMKYLYKFVTYFLPLKGTITARSVSFVTFSLVFMFDVFLLRYLNIQPEFITYSLVFIAILWVFSTFYMQNKPENAKCSAQVFFLVKLSKIAIKLGLIVLLGFIGNKLFIDMHLIPTGSMSPTVHASEVVLSDKLYYKAHHPSRWDSVILKHVGYDYKMLKRIVGMPGDKLEIAGGNVWINDEVTVRPLNVLRSQMSKAPISFVDFEEHYYNNEDKNKKIQLQYNAEDFGGNSEEWQQLLNENFGGQTQTQSRPNTKNELLGEFIKWWNPMTQNYENHEDHIRLFAIEAQGENFMQFYVENSTKTEVNGIKTLTDDIALQLDSSFIGEQELTIGFRSESIDEIIVYSFQFDFRTRTLKIQTQKMDKKQNRITYSNEKEFVLRGFSLRNKMRIQIIDGLPMAIINNAEYKPSMKPVSVRNKIDQFLVLMRMNMKAIDIYSIGLFTPTYYYPHGLFESEQSVDIPEDCYFVLGDNSSFSLDSRDFEVFNVKYKDGSNEMLPIGSDFKDNAEFQGEMYYPYVRRDGILSRAFAVYKPIQLARLID